MAKLTKDELINRIDNLPIDDELKISLMEDVTDSWINLNLKLLKQVI